MAKQKGIIKIEGTISDIGFYKYADDYFGQENALVSASRIDNDPAFQRTRENMAEYAREGKACKTLCNAILSPNEHNQLKNMNIIQRSKAPTPNFFKKVRNIGLILTAVSGAIMAAPVAVPMVLVKLATYLAVAGSVASAVSQITTESGEKAEGLDA